MDLRLNGECETEGAGSVLAADAWGAFLADRAEKVAHLIAQRIRVLGCTNLSSLQEFPGRRQLAEGIRCRVRLEVAR